MSKLLDLISDRDFWGTKPMEYLESIRRKLKISERTLASAVRLSRETVRGCLQHPNHAKFSSLQSIANQLHHEVTIEVHPAGEPKSEMSIVAISIVVASTGFDSWKIHFFNFVDYFRVHPDPRLIALPPVSTLDPKLYALLQGIVESLTTEIGVPCPAWVRKALYLDQPWFVAEFQSLKATALLESSLPFRRRNIFVLNNFLMRA